MATVKLIEPEDPEGKVKEIYDDITKLEVEIKLIIFGKL